MIQYTLKCDQDHRFSSWFQSAAAFDKLAAAGMVCCSICGSGQVEKAPMAPRVATARTKAQAPEAPDQPSLSAPASEAEQMLKALREQVEKNSTYVGKDFVQEARAMHLGETPERQIHGEARPEEAKKLIEDGIPVTPLPFVTGRKTN